MSDLPSRRNFQGYAISALGALAAGIVGLPVVSYLFAKPKIQDDSQDWAEIADLSQMEIGRPAEVVYPRDRKDGWRTVKEKATAWIVKTDRNTAVAFSPACTHLGCAYHWESQKKSFVCPCHDSAFSIEGAVLAGPAPRALDRYPVKVEQGKVLIGSEVEKAV
jgi:menaquinol-cytochrome c reductase iron-sulfur subunit